MSSKKKWAEHDNYTRCKEFLPKPRKKYAGLLVQCEYCGRVYRGYYDGWSTYARWEETSFRGENE